MKSYLLDELVGLRGVILTGNLFNDASGIACHNTIGRNLKIDDGARPHDGTLANGRSLHQHCSGTNPGIFANDNARFALTVGF